LLRLIKRPRVGQASIHGSEPCIGEVSQPQQRSVELLQFNLLQKWQVSPHHPHAQLCSCHTLVAGRRTYSRRAQTIGQHTIREQTA
jgi:hypothetical protein